RVLRDLPSGHSGDRAHKPVIDWGQRGLQKAGDLGLLGGATGTVLAAEFLDLIIVTRPQLTRERGRRAGTELGGARHQPWLAACPLGDQRDDRRYVDPRGGVRPVRLSRGGAIIHA